MERKKVLLLVSGFALVALLGIYIAYSTFSENWESAKPVKSSPAANTTLENDPIWATHEKITEDLSYLDELDQKYLNWPDDSASKGKQSLNNFRTSMENEILKQIDSLRIYSYRLPEQPARVQQNICAWYKRTLANRSGDIADFAESSEPMKERMISDSRLDNLEYDLLKKDELIMDLRQQVVSLQNTKPSLADSVRVYPAAVNYNADNKSGEKDAQYNELRQRYDLLQKEYQAMVNKAQRNESKTDRSAELTSKIEELEAALRLAEVNCNLTRADAREIIYNSKQRKALLENSLNILRNLSASPNQTVQKKAREKMTELKTIASTIRD